MSVWRQLKHGLRVLIHRADSDQAVIDEAEDFIDRRAEEFMTRGLSPEEARRAALLECGNVSRIRDDVRSHGWENSVETLFADLRYAVRRLRSSPGFTAIAIITLALGIGANAAIFSLVDAVLLKPLPYPRPEKIVTVSEKNPFGVRNFISTLNFLDWKEQNRCFQFLSAIANDTVTLTGSSRPQELNVQRVSPSYFKALGVGATLGRTFAPDEDQVGKDEVVVLSDGIWRSRFGGDPEVVGRDITLDSKNYKIIGVLPAGTFDRTWAVVWLPLTFTPADMTRNYHWLTTIARLESGVTLEQARAQMDTLGASIAALYPDSNKGWGVTVDPYIDQVVAPQLRRSLWVLLAAVGAVLLIGCANLANLTLARGTDREHEIAIRSALGAGRLRLVRQLLTENMFLGVLGGVAGLALGYALMHGIKLWLSAHMLPPEANVRMDYRVFLFTMITGILTGTLFGLAPALNTTYPDLTGSLKQGGRTTAGLTRRRLRTALVLGEVAMSFVLLAGASLLIRSFNRLASVDPGVDTTNVLAMDLPMPSTQFTNSTTVTNYLSEVTENVRSVPGVRDAAITDRPPMEGYANGAPFLIEGRPNLPYSQRPICGFKIVGPSYFYTVGMRLLKGRGLEESDDANATPVTVINETMAKTFFKGEDPIGKHIFISQLVLGKRARGSDTPWQVVGVVKDEKVTGKVLSGLGEDMPVIYVTFYQSPGTRNSLVVRATNPMLLINLIERAIWKVNTDQAVENVETLEEIKSQSVAPARVRTVLLTIFAGIAVLLTAVGIYGVISYSVAQRAREMAIRLTLGASPDDLLRLVIGKAMLMVVVGLALGAVASLALTRVLTSLLYDTSPTDPMMWGVAGALLLAVALSACYFPAWRVVKAAPLTTLRGQ
jgi:putative ABC transport system permease protein